MMNFLLNENEVRNNLKPLGKILCFMKNKNDTIQSCITQLGKDINEQFKLAEELGLLPTVSDKDLEFLSPGSFAVQFDFKLTDYWFSKDDDLFYPIENPVRKETVFKIPEMSAGGWKGVFREACRQKDPTALARLFGESDDDLGQAGRLYFFPSFFCQANLEANFFLPVIEPYVINPHSRSTKAGTWPITFEVVPPGAVSRFALIYEAAKSDDFEKDRELVADLIHAVFTQHGFGAKTSIGFGRGKILPEKTDQKKENLENTPKISPKTLKGLESLKGLKIVSETTPTGTGTNTSIQPPCNHVMLKRGGDVTVHPVKNFFKLKKIMTTTVSDGGKS